MADKSSIAEMLGRIEEDHKRLHKLGSTVLQALEVDDTDNAAHCLLELQIVQRTHFELEEKLMAEAGYPDREEHAHSHERLNATLSAINQALNIDRFQNLNRDLGSFIDESISHVKELDRAFEAFLDSLLPRR